MATLAEQGLSSNIGIERHEMLVPENSGVMILPNNSDVYQFGRIQIATFYGIDGPPYEIDDEFIIFSKPDTKTSVPEGSPGQPFFLRKLTSRFRVAKDRVLFIDQEDIVDISSRDDFLDLLGIGDFDEKLKSKRIFIHGRDSSAGFLQQMLDALDLDEVDEDVFETQMNGDHAVAALIVQAANDIGVQLNIPIVHRERAVMEFLRKNVTDGFGIMTVNDQRSRMPTMYSASRRFNDAYGISYDELVDILTIYTEEIIANTRYFPENWELRDGMLQQAAKLLTH